MQSAPGRTLTLVNQCWRIERFTSANWKKTIANEHCAASRSAVRSKQIPFGSSVLLWKVLFWFSVSVCTVSVDRFFWLDPHQALVLCSPAAPRA